MWRIESTELANIAERVKELNDRIDILEAALEPKKVKKFIPHNKGDDIYDMYKEQLEKDHMDEIVAIDIEDKKIVGYGRTVRQAYDDARIKSKNEQFYFKRVGKPYIRRL
jgi:hypothetical protein